MHSPRPKDSCAPHCPDLIREALDLIAGKWTVPIYFALHRTETPLRYADLRRRLEPVTPKELTRHLRQMADVSHAKGELSKQALDSILACGDQLEEAFSAMAPAKLQDLLDALKLRLRAMPPK